MTEAAKQVRREYAKKYRAVNKEKIKEYQNRYWEKLSTKTDSNKKQ